MVLNFGILIEYREGIGTTATSPARCVLGWYPEYPRGFAVSPDHLPLPWLCHNFLPEFQQAALDCGAGVFSFRGIPYLHLDGGNGQLPPLLGRCAPVVVVFQLLFQATALPVLVDVVQVLGCLFLVEVPRLPAALQGVQFQPHLTHFSIQLHSLHGV